VRGRRTVFEGRDDEDGAFLGEVGILELDVALDQRVDCMVSSDANIVAGVKFEASLANDDIPRNYILPAWHPPCGRLILAKNSTA
jgi:hypothetical protein